MGAISHLTAQNLANVAKALAGEVLESSDAETLEGLVNRWIGHNNIRTFVAHHRWRHGSRPDSIRPTFYDARKPKSLLSGYAEDEADYTAQDLFAIAYALQTLNEEVLAFLDKSGLGKIVNPDKAD